MFLYFWRKGVSFFWGGGILQQNSYTTIFCAKSEEKMIITAKSWYQVFTPQNNYPPRWWQWWQHLPPNARRMLNLRRTNAFGAFYKHRWRVGFQQRCGSNQGTNIFPWERLLGRWFSYISGIWDMRLPRKVDDWGPFWYKNLGHSHKANSVLAFMLSGTWFFEKFHVATNKTSTFDVLERGSLRQCPYSRVSWFKV